MTIKIESPVFLNEQGKRDYSEDCIFPASELSDKNNRLFMVCDGVGGSARGDMASQMVCTFFPTKVDEFFQSYGTVQDSVEVQKAILPKALIATEAYLYEQVITQPQFKGMATTLTYLSFIDKGAVIAWAGDSRVYHFSKSGAIKFVTEDHSLVAELLKQKQITKEEALRHPRRNVILRAISGSDNPSKIDIHFIESAAIENGDFFLLCTDGILEGVSEVDLQAWIKMGLSLTQIKEKIAAQCLEFSRDNYSMYLIRIDQVLKPEGSATSSHMATDRAILKKKEETFLEEKSQRIVKSSKVGKLFIIIGILLTSFSLIASFLYKNKVNSRNDLKSSLAEFRKEREKVKEKSIFEKLMVYQKLETNSKANVKSANSTIKKSLDEAFQERNKILNEKQDLLKELKSTQNKIQERYQKIDSLEKLEDINQLKTLRKEILKYQNDKKELCHVLGSFKACLQFQKMIDHYQPTFQKLEIAINEKDNKEEESICEYPLDLSSLYWSSYDEVRCPSEKICAVKKGDKWGFVLYENKVKGTVLFYPKSAMYDEVEDFHKGLAWVKRGDQEGYINQHDYVHPQGLIFKKIERKFGISCPNYVKFTKQDGTIGYMNRNGMVTGTKPNECY